MKFPRVSRWCPTMAMHGFYVYDGLVAHQSNCMHAGLAADIVMQRMWCCMLVRLHRSVAMSRGFGGFPGVCECPCSMCLPADRPRPTGRLMLDSTIVPGALDGSSVTQVLACGTLRLRCNSYGGMAMHGCVPRAAHVVSTGTWRAMARTGNAVRSHGSGSPRAQLPPGVNNRFCLKQRIHRWHIMGIKPSRLPVWIPASTCQTREVAAGTGSAVQRAGTVTMHRAHLIRLSGCIRTNPGMTAHDATP